MTGSRSPRDLNARERLQQAQKAEAKAVADVYKADAALTRTEGKRDAAVAAAEATVDRARTEVARAQGELVEISGRQRAALLLGLQPAELPKSGRAATARHDG